MLDRLATRAMFWCALTVFAAAGGLLSVGGDVPLVLAETGLTMPRTTLATVLPSFSDAAPFLSLSAFAMAIAGWRLLRRALTHLNRNTPDDRARQLQVAMHVNAESMFLLRAIRETSGEISDFEIRAVNPSGARLIRANQDLVIGRRLKRDFPAAVHEPLFAQYLAAMNSHTPMMEEVRVSRRQFAAGWLYHQAVPTGDGVAVTLRDISVRKREEIRLRRASLTDDLCSPGPTGRPGTPRSACRRGSSSS